MEHRFKVDMVQDKGTQYYLIRDLSDYSSPDMVNRFLVHQITAGKSPNTAKARAFAVSYYMTYLDTKGMAQADVLQLPFAEQLEHFHGFLVWLKAGLHKENSKPTGNATCNTYLRSVFSLYDFVALQYKMEALKITGEEQRSLYNSTGIGIKVHGRSFKGFLRETDPKRPIIAKSQIKEMVSVAENLRDKLLILVLAETGCRIGECLGIRYTTDLDYERKQVKIVFRERNENHERAKNGEERWLAVSDETWDILQMYLTEYRDWLKQTEFLFITIGKEDHRKPLNSGAVYKMLGRLEKKTGNHVTPHQFRRYYANERRRAGWRIEEVAVGMGHRSITTTNCYYQLDDEEKENASKAFFKSAEKLAGEDIRKLL